jgi:hypothetical protein
MTRAPVSFFSVPIEVYNEHAFFETALLKCKIKWDTVSGDLLRLDASSRLHAALQKLTHYICLNHQSLIPESYLIEIRDFEQSSRQPFRFRFSIKRKGDEEGKTRFSMRLTSVCKVFYAESHISHSTQEKRVVEPPITFDSIWRRLDEMEKKMLEWQNEAGGSEYKLAFKSWVKTNKSVLDRMGKISNDVDSLELLPPPVKKMKQESLQDSERS